MGRKNVTVVQRHRNEGSAVWYARVRDVATGKVRYVSLRTPRRTEAQLLAADMLRDGDFEDSDGARMTLRQGMDSYFAYLRNKGTSESSIDTYLRLASKFPGIMDARISEISPDRLSAEFSAAYGDASPGYYNMGRTFVRSLFKYFVDILEIVPRNPMRKLPKRKGVRKERKFWTMEQIRLILDASRDARFRLLWAFMAYQGLRVHEALKMRPEDIRDGRLHVVGKGGKYAALPLSPPMLGELDRAGWTWDFSGISQKMCRKRVIIAAKSALGDAYDGEATNHRFRHSFASNLVRAGVNIKAVQQLMRHATITMTLDIYSHLMDGDLSAGIAKLGKA